MNPPTTAVFIYGYARSGKTTLINKLRELGYCCISTSDELNKLTLSYFNLPIELEDALINKDDESFSHALNEKGLMPLTCREAKIYVANHWFIPTYGRRALVGRAIDSQYQTTKESSVVVFETIGGDESHLAMLEFQNKLGISCFIKVNIRKDSELNCGQRSLSKNGHSFKNNFKDSHTYVKSFLHELKLNYSFSDLNIKVEH